MKIRLKSACSFIGLQEVGFPVEVEVDKYGSDLDIFFVSIYNMSKIPGWFWTKNDVWDGCYYTFFSDEVEVVVENPPSEAEAQTSRQEELLGLIKEYGNPFTGVYRSSLIFNKIEKMVREHLS